jgi:hypothetical protein
VAQSLSHECGIFWRVCVLTVLQAFYPGERGGSAIADVLWGVVSPSGRLPYTVPQENFIKRDMLNMDLRSEGGVTYQWMEAEPVWAFGEGGSYSSWEWEWELAALAAEGWRGLQDEADEDDKEVGGSLGVVLRLGTEALADQGFVELPAARVRNTGGVDAEIVSLGFVALAVQAAVAGGGDHAAAAATATSPYPQRALFDFARCSVVARGSESVRLRLSAEALSVVEDDGARWLRPARFSVRVGDDDGGGGGAVLTVELGGTAVRLPSHDWPPTA